MLRNDRILLEGLSTEEMNPVVGADRENYRRPGAEWLPCVAKLFDDVQDQL